MNKQAILARLAYNLEEMQRRFSVRALSIFGSVARDEATGNSDVDVLVAFDKKANFDVFMDLRFYLEELLGTGVDLVTDKALRPEIRQTIEQEIIHVA
ncbi:MAG TPA: nucleotidyltransferase family protein [Sedimentisphaerales bacterium]|nr:nucleotidyltransferase family protein [Sedimentisphaerales bacterium]